MLLALIWVYIYAFVDFCRVHASMWAQVLAGSVFEYVHLVIDVIDHLSR